MVYLHFPTNLTEEELMLQAKYQKLKRKKKALQALKTPRPEPERITISTKRPKVEARDAREVAKKLIKSGAIPAIVRPPKKTEQSGFKRPRGLERKLSANERMVSGYQPFSATQPEDQETEVRPRIKTDLYESFVNIRDRGERGLSEKGREEDKPRQGNTIHVQGLNITEEFLKKTFQNCGHIINISMELEKNRGFISFDKTEAAERAIAEMNGTLVSDIHLKVNLARRQPAMNAITDATSANMWTILAASRSQKGSHKDKRNQVVYDISFD